MHADSAHRQVVQWQVQTFSYRNWSAVHSMSIPAGLQCTASRSPQLCELTSFQAALHTYNLQPLSSVWQQVSLLLVGRIHGVENLVELLAVDGASRVSAQVADSKL